MQLRRLILAPIAAFVATGVVVAVINTGARTRDDADTAELVASRGPAPYAEQLRIDHALDAERACTGRVDCGWGPTIRRVRVAAGSIGSWPPEQQYRDLRHRLELRLDARAALLVQRSLMAASTGPSTADRERLERIADAWVAAARAELRARRDAGLIDRAEQARLTAALDAGS